MSLAESTHFASTFSGAFLVPLAVLVAFAILGYAWKTLRQMNVAVAEIREVKKEVLPNGGSSLRDSVNRIEAEQALVRQEASEVARQLAKHLRKAKRNQVVFDQMVKERLASSPA